MTDRRDFMFSVSSTAAAVGLSTSLPVAALSGTGIADVEHARGRFSEHLNGRFRFSDPQGLRSTDAELVEIVELSMDPQVDQFELVFRAPFGGELGEGIYAMTTPSGDRFARFVQPLAGHGEQREFTVHVCRLV